MNIKNGSLVNLNWEIGDGRNVEVGLDPIFGFSCDYIL